MPFLWSLLSLSYCVDEGDENGCTDRMRLKTNEELSLSIDRGALPYNAPATRRTELAAIDAE